jgi:hypothetical protein
MLVGRSQLDAWIKACHPDRAVFNPDGVPPVAECNAVVRLRDGTTHATPATRCAHFAIRGKPLVVEDELPRSRTHITPENADRETTCQSILAWAVACRRDGVEHAAPATPPMIPAAAGGPHVVKHIRQRAGTEITIDYIVTATGAIAERSVVVPAALPATVRYSDVTVTFVGHRKPRGSPRPRTPPAAPPAKRLATSPILDDVEVVSAQSRRERCLRRRRTGSR